MRSIILCALLALSVGAFAQNNKLNDSSITLTKEVRAKFVRESKNNGKLDYWTPIKGHEFEGEKIEHDFYASKGDAAIIKWAYAVTSFGLKNKADIISLYEELKGREIQPTELNYIDYGYKKAIDKRLKSIAYE
jgi:hypothetical protein